MKTKQASKVATVEAPLLGTFYAVTMTSIYRAVINEKGAPYVEKIAIRAGQNSAVAVGERFSNGTMLSVGPQLILFVPEGHGFMSPMTSVEREIANVNTQWWGGGTSGIVALFLFENDAVVCGRADNLTSGDKRWHQNTVEVLRAIGENHPFCSVTKHPEMELVPVREWL